jgi:hypothetical protein
VGSNFIGQYTNILTNTNAQELTPYSWEFKCNAKRNKISYDAEIGTQIFRVIDGRLSQLCRGADNFSKGLKKNLKPVLKWTSYIQVALIMDNFRRGLHSYLGVGAKTSLGVCLTELKH